MIIASANKALARLFTPEFRAVLWKSLGLTISALVLVWFAFRGLIETFIMPWFGSMATGLPEWSGFLGTIAAIAASVVLALLLALLIAPVTALVAQFFLDDAAEVIEQEDYPDDVAGTALPLGQSIRLSLKFVGVVLLANMIALFLLLVPGINIIAFFLANGYVLGREYFLFAAMRTRTETDANLIRKQHAGTIFFGGLLIAGFLAIPLVNLLTPLFAAAFMVHLHKAVSLQS